MKAKALHFGKAMSAALFVLLLSVAGTKNALAQLQVGTLQHGDIITTFYGGGAFVEAYNAAADGDIITLSGGSFTCDIDIDKSLTIRGAGPVANAETGTEATLLTRNGTINIGGSSSDAPVLDLYMEGIFFPGTVYHRHLINPTFARCNFVYMDYSSGKQMYGGQFINCVFQRICLSNIFNSVFINSVINQIDSPSSDHNYVFYNCQVVYGFTYWMYSLTAYNSIIIKAANTFAAAGDSNFINCIGITLDGNTMFGDAHTENCVLVTPANSPNSNPYEAVYQTFRGGDFNFAEAYLLLDVIATGFPTTNGTEVGIHGGNVPYTSRPFYQMLRTVNVPQHSNTEGKLNVEIEVINQ